MKTNEQRIEELENQVEKQKKQIAILIELGEKLVQAMMQMSSATLNQAIFNAKKSSQSKSDNSLIDSIKNFF